MGSSVQIFVGDRPHAATPTEPRRAGPFAPLRFTRHGRRPLRRNGIVVAQADTRPADPEALDVWHEIDLVLTETGGLTAAIRGRRRFEADADAPLRRCDAAFDADDAAGLRALLEQHDPAPLAAAPATPLTADPDAPDAEERAAAWADYFDEVEAIRADYRLALARLLSASAE